MYSETKNINYIKIDSFWKSKFFELKKLLELSTVYIMRKVV